MLSRYRETPEEKEAREEKEDAALIKKYESWLYWAKEDKEEVEKKYKGRYDPDYQYKAMDMVYLLGKNMKYAHTDDTRH